MDNELYGYDLYQVFSEDENYVLTVDNVDSFDEAKNLYDDKYGYMLLGIIGPTAFNVILARPYGIISIS